MTDSVEPPFPFTLSAAPPFLPDLFQGVAATLQLTDDDAEAAALAVADGAPAYAWQRLAPQIAVRPADPSLWQLAYEVLSLLGNPQALEGLVAAYAEAFGALPPFATAALEQATHAKATAQWQPWPARLTAETAATLIAGWPATADEWWFDVSAVTEITPEAAALLIDALGQRLRKGGKAHWRGLERLLSHYPAQKLLQTPAEVQLAILFLTAHNKQAEAESLALEHALRFDTTPPEWCMACAGTTHAATEQPAEPASEAEAAAADLVLPPVITSRHTEVLLRRLDKAAAERRMLSSSARRIRQWPVAELLALGYGLRRLFHRPATDPPQLLRLIDAPQWLRRAVARTGLAPWVQLTDNNGFLPQ